MTVRVCSHRLSMQSDVLNDQQQQISNDTDCSTTLSTTLIYSGLKLVSHSDKIMLSSTSFFLTFSHSASKTASTDDIHV